MKTKTEKKAAPGKGLVGRKSGLNKRAFFVQSLKENEKAKRPDAELQKVWEAEFPGTVSYPVKGMRAKLNRGGFGEVGFVSNPHGEPTSGKKPRAKKEVFTIGIPEMSAPAPAGKA